jgi:hypothetical protein
MSYFWLQRKKKISRGKKKQKKIKNASSAFARFNP